MSDATESNVADAATDSRKATADFIAAIFNSSLQTTGGIPNEIILSPGKPPQLQASGRLSSLNLSQLTPNDTARIANDLTAKNDRALRRLVEEGACDVSVSLPKLARLRAQIFRQRGTYVIAIRVGRTAIPDFASLNLPPTLAEVASLDQGLVLVAGGPGSGKSSTIAALIDRINERCAYNIVTLENPVEFLHLHKNSLVHQRELYSDMPNYELGMQSALRQGAKVIMLSDLSDRHTTELALTAADTGRLVISSMETANVVRTAERIVSLFPLEEHKRIRGLLGRSFRYLIAQQLLPRKDGGRVPSFEILRSSSRTRAVIDRGEDWSALVEAMSSGNYDEVQTFEQELEKLIRKGVVSLEVGLRHSSRPDMLRIELADLGEERGPA
ncbi:MAG TPA: ATPase, T2SS/T4P/T4SS family [Terriglobales bacterium]|nr:ATPase, T2SS/T4P/T4SS family [Terriglobales bacterium]